MRFSTRLVAALLLAAGAAACTDTRTITTPIPPGKVAGRISLNPVFSASAKTIAASIADFGITFDRVRVRIRNTPDTNTVVLDTTVAFGPSSAPLVLDLTVPVTRVGEQFDALVEYIGTTGTVYSGSVVVQSYAPDGVAPEQPSLVLSFVGPGAKLKTLAVTPKPVRLVGSQTLPLTITATDSNGAALPVPPLLFTSSDESVAKIVTSGSTRSVQSLGKRGQARIVATTPIGIQDTLSAIVSLPAASVAVVSGGDQSATVGTQLAQPVVVQVSAADGVGVPDVTVTFTPPAGASVGSPTAVTDANGRASTTATLSTTAGAQAFGISAGSVPAIIFGASARPGPASAATSTLSANGTQINADNQSSVIVSVLTRDQFGNQIGTGGATVTLTTTIGRWDNGTATTTTATDNGDGSYSATLRSAQSGTATVTGTVAGVAIAAPAVSITAIPTVLDHFDVTLANGTPITGEQRAGVATALRVRALDLSGNVVASYNSQTTLSIRNSTLLGGGPDIVLPAAANGIITTSVQFGRPGTNVQLTAGGAAKSGQSAIFTVVPGPPALIVVRDSIIRYGMGATPQQYPSVNITDGAGNIAGRQPVAFTVTGPCRFAGNTTSTQITSDVEGVIQFNSSTLTIPTVGADFPFSCQLVANGVGYTAPTARIALLVEPSEGTVWRAHTSDAWELPDNWTNDTPSSSKRAFIAAAQPRATPIFPVLRSDNQFIPSVDVEDGAQLNLGGRTLNLFQSVDARTTGAITNGVINLSGNGGLMRGTLPTVVCQGGQHLLEGTTRVANSLTLGGGCFIDLRGQRLTVTENFSSTVSGAVAMTQAADTLQLEGLATFGGVGGNLSAGVLNAYGDFRQSGIFSTFAPTGTHLVRLLSRSSPQNQSVTFDNVDSAGFQNLTIDLAPGRTVTINSAVQVKGTLTVSSGTTGGGSLSLPAGLYNQLNGPIAVVGTMGINLGGVINTSSLSFSAGTITLIGNANLVLANGSGLTLGDNLNLVVNVSGNLGINPQNPPRCTRGANVTITGTKTDVVAALKQACGVQ